MMSEPKTELLQFLKTIKGIGSFSTSGEKKYQDPGLMVNGLGQVVFPINAIQARAVISVAEAAPFGKGSQTVMDREVRNGWQIDASLLSFQEPKWDAYLNKIVQKAAAEMGLKGQKVTASLYKLLIYEEGGFFKTHKDSEKEPGMFGTLVIGLPSSYTGGELRVRFEEQEATFAFAEASTKGKTPYAAFYSDCDHELLPVTSGYRVALVYNLLQETGTETKSTPSSQPHLTKLMDILPRLVSNIQDKPLAILLGHQYTTTNFLHSKLKLDDKPRADLLLQAAEKVGYLARLALVTHYQLGELEGADYYYNDYSYRSRRGYDRDEEPESGEMGDVMEEYTEVKYWLENDLPTLGTLYLNEEDMLTDLEIGVGKPSEKEEEGYTGNAGMTMEYWYHYGAVVLWPKSKHLELLEKTEIKVKLDWLRYYLAHWNSSTGLPASQHVPHLLTTLGAEELEDRFLEEDFSVIAQALAQPACRQLWTSSAPDLLTAAFTGINAESWIQLAQSVEPAMLTPSFKKAAKSGEAKKLNHYLGILLSFIEVKQPELESFVLQQLEDLAQAYQQAQVSKLKKEKYDYYNDVPARIETAKAIVQKILLLSQLKEAETDWLYELLDALVSPGPRKYVNKVLVATVLADECPGGSLSNWLRHACIGDLQDRTAVLPQPPENWSMAVPSSNRYRDEWEMLRSFLESTTQQFFDYSQNEAYRDHLTRIIQAQKIDLRMETIRKGRPYTLRITKTQATYETELKNYKEDQKLLRSLGE
jgi:hypothetical protein